MYCTYVVYTCTGGEWQESADITDRIYGKEYWEIYERALDSSTQCTEEY